MTAKVIGKLLDEILNFETSIPAQLGALDIPQRQSQQQMAPNCAAAYSSGSHVPVQGGTPEQVDSMLMDHISNEFYDGPCGHGSSEEFLTWLEGLDLDTACSTMDYGLSNSLHLLVFLFQASCYVANE
ncbi:hypothetical protein N7456_005723 [Penicillium angulare]|uniref:Uncharacterized protein n=1 Tax=Penicillium angulare TaxID=116970 RepID=A0A9W9KKT0_9EURO|nr:hypothetical protein N7456_005723 [Penicillium angulare]